MTTDVNKWPWWQAANERRAELIGKKHGDGLTGDEATEFTILQGIAEVVVESVSPPMDFGPLEALAKRFEALAAKVQAEIHRTSERRGQ